MAPDTTAPSYWLNWRVFLCAIVIFIPMVIAVILIWKYEGFKKGEHERRENQSEPPGTLYEDEAWKTSLKGIHPAWLLAFRIFSFVSLLGFLIANVVLDGGGIFYFYTQWTFALVTIYFGYASTLSIYGCSKYLKEGGDDGESRLTVDTEQDTFRPLTLDETADGPKTSITHQEPSIRKSAGSWVRIFQVIFQTCAGAVMLTDIVFWLILYPFTKGYKLSFIDVMMHSMNAVFLLGDTVLNSLRFPMFRIAYFVLWSDIFVIYQWIIHACKPLWWPYQFLDLSSSYAPLWYLGVGLVHLPSYGFFALIIKLKNFWLSRPFPDSYRSLE